MLNVRTCHDKSNKFLLEEATTARKDGDCRRKSTSVAQEEECHASFFFFFGRCTFAWSIFIFYFFGVPLSGTFFIENEDGMRLENGSPLFSINICRERIFHYFVERILGSKDGNQVS